jgi:hypothetical protein
MNSFERVLRLCWRGGFGLYSTAVGSWLIRNVLTQSYAGKGAYLTRISVCLTLLGMAWYLLAFRSTDVRIVECILSLVAMFIVTGLSEVTIRAWDHYDPIFRPVKLEDRVIFPKEMGPRARTVYGPYPPGTNVETHGHAGMINSFGFRGHEYPIEKTANAFRILALGDSFTFGQGVEEHDIYTTLLERELAERHPEKHIEVINTGIMGYSAIDEMNLLHRIGDLIDPD